MTAPTLTDLQTPFEAAIRRIALAHETRRLTRPSDAYVMGRQDWPEEKRFQLAFHRSGHIIRAMFLGNGAGKTTVAGVEADWWLQHCHPFQSIQRIPAWPIQVCWVTLKFQQMDILREQLESNCLTPGWAWNDSKHKYTWPNRSSLHVISNDGDWASIQGVGLDLVIIDEECDRKLWRELTMRRRGRKKTRFVIPATATKGKRWMYHEIYRPWLEYHHAQGIDEARAMQRQLHPSRWVWPFGGIEDNPAHTPDDLVWYQAELAHASPAERQVRLRGGFVDLNASPVFDPENMDKVEAKAKELVQGGMVGAQGMLYNVEVKDRKKPHLPAEFEFRPDGSEYEGGKIIIYEPPGEDNYVIGADFGAGLENRDWDAAVVLSHGGKRQVAQALGRWGDVHMAWVLWALGWYYGEALIVGERQFGLPALRRMHDEWGYSYFYRDLDDEAKQSPRKSDLLGHHRHHGDLIIPRAQWAIAPMEQTKDGRLTGRKFDPIFQIVDPMLLHQLRVYEWKPKSSRIEMPDATMRDLSCGAPRGDFDDLVMAFAYAVTGWIELPRFRASKPRVQPGSIGAVLGHDSVKIDDSRSGGKAPRKAPGAFRFARKPDERDQQKQPWQRRSSPYRLSAGEAPTDPPTR